MKNSKRELETFPLMAGEIVFCLIVLVVLALATGISVGMSLAFDNARHMASTNAEVCQWPGGAFYEETE